MPFASRRLEVLALSRGFEHTGRGPGLSQRYILDGGDTRFDPFIILDITEGRKGFRTDYNRQRPYPQARYHGQFGPRGGCINYDARETVKEIRDLPVRES